MDLKILLPNKVFADLTGVMRIVIETQNGSFGILPQRLDCAAAIVPGILTYETQRLGEVFVAIDQGIIVKNGNQVLISVRRAFSGVPLEALRETIQEQFLSFNEQEQALQNILTKLESGFLKRFSEVTKV